VHIGRRSGQSLARERHTGEHEAHSPTRRTFRDIAAERQQRLLPTVMRKKPLRAFDELERAHDLRAKLIGRLQYTVGDDDYKSASEAIVKRESDGRLGGGWESDGRCRMGGGG
jgi:hypothetical protein